MYVTVITPPAPIVSLLEAKRHLRIEVENTDDDPYITTLIAAATKWIDGPAGWLGRALGGQVLEMRMEEFGCWLNRLRIPYPPLVSVDSVSYLAADDSEVTIDEANYLTSGQYLWFKPSFRAPSLSQQPEPVIIRFRAGYGAFDTSDPPVWVNACPEDVKVAILMLVGNWFQNREPVVLGLTVEQLPFAVEALLSTYRVFS